jgi:hypothetical protein
MQIQVREILEPLSPMQNEAWYQLRPNRRLWEAREYLTGAPAVLRSELNYRFIPPPNVCDLLLQGSNIDRIDNFYIATRRWVAANIARVAKNRNISDIINPADFISRCFPDLDGISKDGLLAAQGLIHELATLPDDGRDVPGFRGPDDWYAGS